ncbi:hypothetical protein [Paenibacillus dendritiformis]|uniref:hypothetical protein n=1 Tax=Paenibacillus dendritiformis TaxID=130049 RepID=UPI000DA7F37B|nr:hypothetical protein [Paenibacillus dendritiformis]PZM67604.1 hypothetical protein DOE73_00425 [Paenibacillus dendritiformis]
MAEKNILAYFKSPEEAESVSKKLQALHVVDMSIDRFSMYPASDSYGSPNLTGSMGSLTSVTLLGGDSTNVLAATNVSASGMSDGGQGGPTGRDILLTVVVEEESFDKAMRIIEDAGGMV